MIKRKMCMRVKYLRAVVATLLTVMLMGVSTFGAFGAENSTGTGTSEIQNLAESLKIFDYNYEYNKTLVYKINVANKPDIVKSTFEQTLETIKWVNKATAGLKQIVYLVGWQYNGHDSKYPAFFEVNQRLKRAQDTDARDSLIWLMEEAKKYNAVVSLHINMDDAYKNSPLWDEYVQNDLLVKDATGALRTGGFWAGEQSYLVSKTEEWRKGFTQKRIDRLLEYLPQLKDAGTIHIDVFQPFPCTYHGITRQDEFNTLKEILKYWKSKGIDVTTEWLHHELLGMVPMVWHYNVDEDGRLKYPSSLVCGGGDGWNHSKDPNRGAISAVTYFNKPEGGCLYEEPWGRSMDVDIATNVDPFIASFYVRTLPWYYLNSHTPESVVNTRDKYEVCYNGGVAGTIDKKNNNHFYLKEGDRTLIDGKDVFMPALWTDTSWIAYSEAGYDRKWQLPDGWENAKKLVVKTLTGKTSDQQYEITDFKDGIQIKLGKYQAIIITPVFDQTAPVSTATVNGTVRSDGTYNSHVSVTLASEDEAGGSGVAGIEYSLDGTNWLAYTAPLELNDNGTYSISYKATDNAGNTEAVKNVSIIISMDPDVMVSYLKEKVNAMSIEDGVKNSLVSKLDNVLSSIAKGNKEGSTNQLNAFINEVDAQIGKKLTVEQADELKAEVNKIIIIINK